MTKEKKEQIREIAKGKTDEELEKWEFIINMTDRFDRDDGETLDIIWDEMAKRKGSKY